MKIVIIGYGLLGKSIFDILKRRNEIVLIDTDKLSTLSEHHDADGIIVCANTDINEILQQIPVFLPILIRSSISPDDVDTLRGLYPDHSIVIFPELSRTTKTGDDFTNQKYVVLGGEDPECFWQDLLQSNLPNCNLVFSCSDKEAALIKYATDGFLALKSCYFNQLYDVCNLNGLDFNVVRQIMNHDNRIGSEFTMVPNADGKRGWLNSDTNELLEWSNSADSSLTILDTALQYNADIRKSI